MDTGTKRSRTITWEDPTLALRSAPGKTGLEQLRLVFEGKLPPPPIAITMGFTGAEFEEGKAVFVAEPAEYHYNPIGTVHGGFALTLLDSAMSCAVHSERYTTVEAKVNFVRPITVETGRVRCEGTIVHRGGTIATAEGKLIAESTGKLLAHGTTTCLITR
jgi:uncharacterized protein (TIGR00369 family)